MKSKRVDYPSAVAFMMVVVLAASMTSPNPAAAQGIGFIDKSGASQPIENKCLTTDKCDAKWLSLQYPSYAGKKLRVAVTRNSEPSAATEWSVSGVEDILVRALLQTKREQSGTGSVQDAWHSMEIELASQRETWLERARRDIAS